MVITGYGIDLAVEAMKLGARDFVDKPIDLIGAVVEGDRHNAEAPPSSKLAGPASGSLPPGPPGSAGVESSSSVL